MIYLLNDYFNNVLRQTDEGNFVGDNGFDNQTQASFDRVMEAIGRSSVPLFWIIFMMFHFVAKMLYEIVKWYLS